jgi:hypothetical protein
MPWSKGFTMCKLSLSILCIGAALVISSGAYARGGTYHHAEFVPLRSQTTTAPGGWALQYSPAHHHYHLIYR